jgi:hypothetical protein
MGLGKGSEYAEAAEAATESRKAMLSEVLAAGEIAVCMVLVEVYF